MTAGTDRTDTAAMLKESAMPTLIIDIPLLYSRATSYLHISRPTAQHVVGMHLWD